MNVHIEQNKGLNKHNLATAYVGVWSIRSGSMLHLNRSRLKKFPLSLFLFEDGVFQPPLGHIGISSFEDGRAVVGGFVVDPSKRGQGLGSTLLWNLMVAVDEAVPGIDRLISFVNEPSVHLFKKVGGKVIGQRDEPAATGCNTIIDLSTAYLRTNLGGQNES